MQPTQPNGAGNDDWLTTTVRWRWTKRSIHNHSSWDDQSSRSTTNINTAPNAGGTTTIGNPTSTTQLNGTVNFANAPTIPLATDNLWVERCWCANGISTRRGGSVLSVVGTTPTWSSANVLNAVGGLAPITNINARDNNVGGGTEAVTNIGYDDLSSGGADNPSQTNIRGNTNLGSNNGNNGGATTTSVVGNTNINASNPNSPTTQTTTVGYNDPDGAGANVASTTNILGTTNLSGSTNNIGTTDNTLAGAPESQITIGYNDPDGGGPNGPSSTTINGNVTFANAPAIPLATDNIWRGVGGVQTTHAPLERQWRASDCWNNPNVEHNEQLQHNGSGGWRR